MPNFICIGKDCTQIDIVKRGGPVTALDMQPKCGACGSELEATEAEWSDPNAK